MDVKLVNPFLEATVNVLKTMAFTDVTAGKPFLKDGKEAHGDITGIISFSGDATGSLSRGDVNLTYYPETTSKALLVVTVDE